MRRKFLVAVPIVLLLSVSTCNNACNSPTAPITSTIPPLGMCILQASLADLVDGISDPLAIVSAIVTACQQYGAVTVEAIISYIESALASSPALDSGVGLSAKQIARLHKVHAAAITQQHIVPVPTLVESGLQ
jgi:hypothetical protein